jgi:hypothetical protein
MLKLAAFVALFGGLCWFGTTVPLGEQTLFGHLRAISATKESQELLEGTKRSAKPLVDNVRRRIAGMPERDEDPAPTAGSGPSRAPAAGRPDAGAPHEELSPSDRQRLRKLLTAAERAAARP